MAVSDEQIGKNLARLRGDMTQKEVAAAMKARGWKWSQTTVWGVENGERPLRLAEADDLADILRASIVSFSRRDVLAALDLARSELSSAAVAAREALRTFSKAQMKLAIRADAVENVGETLPDGGLPVQQQLLLSMQDIVAEVERDLVAKRELDLANLQASKDRRAALYAELGEEVPVMPEHLVRPQRFVALVRERREEATRGEHPEAP